MALPPLHFLHAVEAAARLGSFRAAATELHLTPSAVSQQIRAVEEALGGQLFVRRGRAVVLTPEGQLYCQDVRRLLGELEEAGRKLSRESGTRLRLSTVDFLAHEFLIPRLASFEKRFPGVELHLETTMRVMELAGSEIDCALRVRGAPRAGLASEPVGRVFSTVVSSPSRARRLKRHEDLFDETLLEMGASAEGFWRASLAARGAGDRPLKILTLESYFQSLTAAERDLGVAFGLFPMTTEWVTSGRLAVPFPARFEVDGGAYLVFRAHDRRRALFTEIAAFLREEYAKLPPLPPGRIVPGGTAPPPEPRG